MKIEYQIISKVFLYNFKIKIKMKQLKFWFSVAKYQI